MQINRLFEIVYILLDKKRVTAKELSEYFEVSTRTIYRDIETLSGAGIPVYMNKGKGGGIALLPEFVLNKTAITKQEREDILSSLNALREVMPDDMKGNIKNTADKFKSILGSGEADTDWLEVDFAMWSDGKRESCIFQQIKQSILQKKVVRLEYISINGGHARREIEPLKLVFKGGAWYIYAFCRLREDYRFFRLRRIDALEITDEYYTRKCPDRILAENKQYDNREFIKVKIRIEKERAFRAYDEFENCEMQSDGSVIVQMNVAKTDWLLEYLLNYGEMCEIVEPEELREDMRRLIGKMIRKYEKS